MALYKEIRQADGVVTKYHRILSLMQAVNEYNAISVVSYTDEEARKSDVLAESNARPYRNAVTYQLAYNETMTIETAYKHLKTLPLFEGAEDV